MYQFPPAVAAALLFPFGACIGSFLNVVAYRLPQGMSLSHPGSHCPRCGTPIRWHDNVPIFGWLLLLGRGRCCKGAISPRYPFIELLTALLWSAIGYVYFQDHPRIELTQGAELLAWLFFYSNLMALSLVDLDHQIIPDRLSIGGTIGALIASAALPGLHPEFVRMFPAVPGHLSSLLGALAGALTGAGALMAINIGGSLLMRRHLQKLQEQNPEVDSAIGFGDVKLLACVGAMQGWSFALLTVLIGCVYGSVFGIAEKIRTGSPAPQPGELPPGFPDTAGWTERFQRRWRSGVSLIPFGPFLCGGSLTLYFFGTPILGWFRTLFFPE